MNVSLTPELEKFVEDKVKTGMYQTASEVVREGLRLLKDQDSVKQRQMEELRRRIAVGTQQAERGELVDGAEAFKRLRQRSDERRRRSS
jgi:antitoxin ParD1/3/4